MACSSRGIDDNALGYSSIASMMTVLHVSQHASVTMLMLWYCTSLAEVISGFCLVSVELLRNIQRKKWSWELFFFFDIKFMKMLCVAMFQLFWEVDPPLIFYGTIAFYLSAPKSLNIFQEAPNNKRNILSTISSQIHFWNSCEICHKIGW